MGPSLDVSVILCQDGTTSLFSDSQTSNTLDKARICASIRKTSKRIT